METEVAAHARLTELRHAVHAAPPPAVKDKLIFSIAELRILLACRDRKSLAAALRRADQALAMWDAWQEGAGAG